MVALKARQSKKTVLALQEQSRTLSILEIELAQALREYFQRLKRKVVKNIRENYDQTNIINVSLLITPIINEYAKVFQELIAYYDLRAYSIGKVNAEMITETILTKKISLKAESILQPSLLDDSKSLFRVSPDIQKKLKENSYITSSKTLGSISDDLNKTLLQGYTKGKGNREVAKTISDKFDQISIGRAERIAVTEINSMQNKGAYDQYTELGVEYIQWWSARDNRVRPDHEKRHGEIVKIGDTFGNGLLFPGDREHGGPKDWIWCRCTSIPYNLPLDKVPPAISPFKETELINNPYYQKPQNIEEALNQKFRVTVTNNMPDGYDKWALSDSQLKILRQLQSKDKDKLKFLERRELRQLEAQEKYNKLINKQLLGQELEPFEENELRQLERSLESLFRDAKLKTSNKKYVFDSNDRDRLRELRVKGKEKFTTNELKEFEELRDKKLFKNVLDRYEKGTLSYTDSETYVKYYNKYKTKWEIPNINVKKLTVTPSNEEADYFLKFNHGFEGKIKVSSKYRLSDEQEQELYNLQVKRLFNEGKLLEADSKKLQSLLDQREFNYLYSFREQERGLEFVQELRYRKLYRQLKTKLKLNPKLLNSTFKPVKQKPLKTNETQFIRLTGSPENGIPTQYSLDELFTQDPRRLSDLDKRIVQDWTNDSFKQYRAFLVDCEANPTLYREYLEREAGHTLTDRQFGEKLGNIVERCNRLMELCKNQTKKSMITWRYQRNPHIEDTTIGSTFNWKGFNSTAITKDGADYFKTYMETHSNDPRPYKWLFEIEYPEGGAGIYVSPLARPPTEPGGDTFRKEMELLTFNPKFKLIEYNKEECYAKLRLIENNTEDILNYEKQMRVVNELLNSPN